MTESGSKQQRPREFWITIYPETLDIDPRVSVEKPLGVGVKGNPNKYIHVIEASYAKELEAKLAVAVEALEFYADRNSWALLEDSSNFRSEIDHDDLQEFRPNRKAEYCGGLKARAALEQLKGAEMSEKFKTQYLGSFREDSILKALRKSFTSVADKDRQLFLAQSIIKNGIESIRSGAKSEDVLTAVLDSMGKLINELHKQAVTKAMHEVKPILFRKDEP